MRGIAEAVISKNWVEYGIHSWNDLMRQTFGTVNSEYGIYLGEQGLIRAINELQAFYRKYHRRPVAKSKGMNSIIQVIQRKYWVSFGITSWSGLLSRVFEDENN
ncbi:MAG: hypothetical protein JSW11_10215 [Candidatus Heimdallarchaeota archaeon]|nr:MAG: hypothetical protein JSW11_10215 [Candidatus Heimdallarchaeota archaeon]